MKKVLTVVLVGVMFTTGCSAAWLNTLETILSVAAPALIDILQIVAVTKGVGVNPSLVGKINTDATNIKQIASDLANADAAAAPGVCSQLKADIAVYQQDQQLVLQSAQVSNEATQTKIMLLSNLVAGTTTAILSLVPQCNAASLSGVPPLKVSSFVKNYNAILVIKTGNVGLDAVTPTWKLHEHSKFVRIITFGLLN